MGREREREREREVRRGVTRCWRCGRVRRAVIAAVAVVVGFEVRWGRRYGGEGGEFLDVAKEEARVSCKGGFVEKVLRWSVLMWTCDL